MQSKFHYISKFKYNIYLELLHNNFYIRKTFYGVQNVKVSNRVRLKIILSVYIGGIKYIIFAKLEQGSQMRINI